ncbi:MAG: GNAT family N-acetyltransferase [Oscillospiraceae bacterium]|nr:GNAT family N-acetyltransferase [Oscillospiraceae bacterium]
MITLIRKVDRAELDGAFLWDFDTYQCYHHMWVKEDGAWALRRTSVVRQWNDSKKLQITRYLAWLLDNGGQVLGAYAEDRLVGFLSLDKDFGGSGGQYLNLSMLFVDSRYRRQGVGKYLFADCVKRAAALGAKKLFISSIPAAETVAFYLAMGCADASEDIPEWVDMPYDRYLEYTLNKEGETA